MNHTSYSELTKLVAKTASLCAAVVALGISATNAAALEISGLIKVNGTEMSGVVVAALLGERRSRNIGVVKLKSHVIHGDADGEIERRP